MRFSDRNGSIFVTSRAPAASARSADLLRATQLNGIPVHLLNGMPQSDHIATRGFCRTTGGVLGKFCLVYPQQEVTLLH